MKITKKQFIELTGENPEDVLGPDFEQIIEELCDKEGVKCQEQKE